MRRLIRFLLLFHWFSIRHMLRHRWRAIAVICGIALGAAVFTSVRLAVHASMDSFTRSMDVVVGRADGVLFRPGSRVSEDLVRDLFRNSSVAAVSPVLSTYVRPAVANSTPFLLIGMDPILDRPLHDWTIETADDSAASSWLELIRTPGSLLISQQLADRYALAVGDSISLAHSTAESRFHVVGILADRGLATAEGGFLAIADIATFQEFSGLVGIVDRIDIGFKPNISPAAIDRIRKQIGPAAVLADPFETKRSGQQLIRAYQLNLSVLGFASLFVGMFLVYSLIALNATARRQELAVLRSLGASDQTIFQLFLSEGLLLGLVGWMIAIPSGAFIVNIMLQGISRTIATLFVRVNVQELSLNPWEIILSLCVTLGISLLAAYVPARQAMRIQPREAMSLVPGGKPAGARPFALARIGLVCLALIVPLSFLPGIGGFPLPGYGATLLLFAGFALLAPYTLRQSARAAGRLATPFLGQPGKLALRYITHSGQRTAVSVGALITAVALFTALVIMIHSFRETVETWVTQTVSGDLFVSPRMAELNQHKDPLSPETIAFIRGLGETVDVVPFQRYHLSQSGVRYQVEAMDFDMFARHGQFLWKRGNPVRAYERTAAGKGVLISEVMAARTGLGIGDMFETLLADRRMRLPVEGIIRDYRTNGGVVFCSLDFLKSLLSTSKTELVERWSGARLFVSQSTASSHRSDDLNAIRNRLLIAADGAVDVILGRELRRQILKIFDETFAVTFILLLIALLVATLGIATTMTILVLERAQQLNTLVAIGADQSQIRRMILWEAGFMVVLGEILGLGCGLILSFLLVYVINAQSFGWTFLYQINWQQIWMSLPLIFGTTFVAALPAIRLVFGMPPADLLRERAYG